MTVRIPSFTTKEFADKNQISKTAPGFHGLKDVDDNYKCTSSCFLVFVAGVNRQSDVDKLGTPILGIHRPYLTEARLKELSSDKAMSTASSTRAMVENYLKEMGVPANYSDLMFSVSKDEIRWITKQEYEEDF